jgi:hypothetical protein
MNRKDLEKKFNFFGNNNDISLYMKGHASRGLGYLGNISLINGKAKFRGKSYSDLESLYSAMKEWGDSLEWPVDTYNPMMNECYRLESRITWYLEEKLGFERDMSEWEDGTKYIRKIGPGYYIHVRVYNIKDEVSIDSKYAGMTLTQKVEDADTAVASIVHMVRSEILMMAKDMIDTLSLLPEKDVTDIEMFVDSKRSFFGIEKADFKSVMVDLLEKELKQIKGE